MFAMNEKNIAIFHLNNDVLTARTAGHILHGRVNVMRVFHKYVLTDITKTCLYNFGPLKPHFYIVKLGFTGVYIILLISVQKHRLCEAVLTSTLNLCFEQKYEKYSNFLSENFQFFGN